MYIKLERNEERAEKISAAQMQFTDKVVLFGRRGGMLYFIVSMSTGGTTLAVLTTATTFVHKNKGKARISVRVERGTRGRRIESEARGNFVFKFSRVPAAVSATTSSCSGTECKDATMCFLLLHSCRHYIPLPTASRYRSHQFCCNYSCRNEKFASSG